MEHSAFIRAWNQHQYPVIYPIHRPNSGGRVKLEDGVKFVIRRKREWNDHVDMVSDNRLIKTERGILDHWENGVLATTQVMDGWGTRNYPLN